jgi:hypothetical protein
MSENVLYGTVTRLHDVVLAYFSVTVLKKIFLQHWISHNIDASVTARSQTNQFLALGSNEKQLSTYSNTVPRVKCSSAYCKQYTIQDNRIEDVLSCNNCFSSLQSF